MQKAEQARNIFFAAGSVPTAQELAQAKALGMTAFRNAKKPGALPVGECTLAGAVPERYRKLPNVKIVAAKRESTAEELEAEAKSQAEADAKNKNRR
jgi:hypothetical protein